MRRQWRFYLALKHEVIAGKTCSGQKLALKASAAVLLEHGQWVETFKFGLKETSKAVVLLEKSRSEDPLGPHEELLLKEARKPNALAQSLPSQC